MLGEGSAPASSHTLNAITATPLAAPSATIFWSLVTPPTLPAGQARGNWT
jgi:hypothetical protein